MHAIWVERIETDVRSLQQAAVILTAMGGKPQWPDLDERIDEFEQALAAEPKRLDADELALRAALGLRRPGG